MAVFVFILFKGGEIFSVSVKDISRKGNIIAGKPLSAKAYGGAVGAVEIVSRNIKGACVCKVKAPAVPLYSVSRHGNGGADIIGIESGFFVCMDNAVGNPSVPAVYIDAVTHIGAYHTVSHRKCPDAPKVDRVSRKVLQAAALDGYAVLAKAYVIGLGNAVVLPCRVVIQAALLIFPPDVYSVNPLPRAVVSEKLKVTDAGAESSRHIYKAVAVSVTKLYDASSRLTVSPSGKARESDGGFI